MSEHYCSHQPPCCPQLDILKKQALLDMREIQKVIDQRDALRSRVAEMEKALTHVHEFIAEVRAYGTPLKPSEMNVIDNTVRIALKEGDK